MVRRDSEQEEPERKEENIATRLAALAREEKIAELAEDAFRPAFNARARAAGRPCFGAVSDMGRDGSGSRL